MVGRRIIAFSCLFIFLIVLQTAMAADLQQVPGGQTEDKLVLEEGQIDSDVFGKKGGYLHPFLLIEGRWTDNLYYTESNEEDEFITTVSPGLWVALPSNREKLLDLGTTTTAPGGLKISRIKPEATRKYQGYLLYSPEFVFYSRNSGHNCTNHQAEGLFQYNFNMGLSIDVVDQFNINNEPNNNGISDRIDEYRDNLFNLIVLYQTPERFKFRFDYSNYDLGYDDDINAFRDRNDDSFAFYFFYKIKPKTSVFVEYEFSDITYDEASDSDSKEDRYFAGLQWEITAKTKGRIKLGYTEKDFDAKGAKDTDDFSLEIQTQHNFTPKRALQLTGFRKFHESSMISAPSYLSTGISASWLQRFSEKWSGTLELSYSNDEYDGLLLIDGKTDEREDDTFSIAPAIRYKFRDWLVFDLAYIYTNRDSSFKTFEYVRNTFFLRVDVSI